MELGELVAPAKVQRAGNTDYPVLSMTMHDGLVAQTDRFKKRIASLNTSDYKVVRRGQLVVGFPINEGVLDFQLHHDAALVSPAYGVWNLRDESLADRTYLKRFLKSPRAIEYYVGKMKGSTARRRSLPAAEFNAMPIPLPPLTEQRRIAAILDHADALRAKRRQVLTHLDSLTHSIFHDMFGHPALVTRWRKRRLGDIARIIRGASPRPAGDPRFFGGDIPWLKISDFTAESGPIVRVIKEGVTEAGRAKSVLLPPGTLVLTNSATVGVPKIVELETCIHDGFLAFLDIAEDVDQFWLWSALTMLRPQLVALAPEGTQKNLNGPIVKAVEIGIPPLDLQQAFVAKIVSSGTVRESARLNHLAGDELFASLQSRAFRGEL